MRPGGREIFLSYEDKKGTLFGLLRLRIDKSGDDIYPAMVREDSRLRSSRSHRRTERPGGAAQGTGRFAAQRGGEDFTVMSILR